MDHPPPEWAVDSELIASRAKSFGNQAANYAAHRPTYSRDAVAFTLEPVRDRTELHVLDLAAGTGKLTEVIVALGIEVTAVEPDPDMLAELRRALPGVRAIPGAAEQIPLPDAAVDAVLVGQALHWFDLTRAVPEIARVLRPSGVLAGLWNLNDDRAPWVAELAEISGSSASVRGWAPENIPDLGPSFTDRVSAQFPHSQRRTADSMVATVATHSHILVLDEAERHAVLERLHAKLRSHARTAVGEFDLPLVTAVIRTIRT